MLDSNSLYVVDENGNEKRMTILFTFESDEYQKKYHLPLHRFPHLFRNERSDF